MPRSSRTTIIPALLALLCAAPSSPALAKPRALRVACAAKHGGRLRYVIAPAACRRRTERPVRFGQDAVVRTCVGARRVVRRARGRCGRELLLPGAGARTLCVDVRTHVVRGMPCRRRRDFRVVVPGRATPPVMVPITQPADAPQLVAPPVASLPRDDEATTDEDTVLVVPVLDNDTGVSRVTVDRTGTTGEVTLLPDGTISYDPRGRFDALGPAEQATDTFSYRAGDGAATVFVTVTGLDDAPVLGGVEGVAPAFDITATLSRSNVAVTDNTGPGIAVDGSGAVAVTGTVDGPDGIGLTGRAGGVDAEVGGNLVRGGGVNVVANDATRVRVSANTVPDDQIELTGDALCADLSDNIAAGLLLSAPHGFGIVDLVPDPADAAAAGAFVATTNPASTTVAATGAQFTSCDLPF